MAFILNPKSDLLKNTGNFNAVPSPAKFAPLIAAAAPALLGGGGAAVAAGGAAAAGGGGAAAAASGGGAGEAGKIMNMMGKSKGGSSKEKTKTKPQFHIEDDDSYYGE